MSFIAKFKIPDLNCPKCDKPIGLIKQIAEFLDEAQDLEGYLTPPNFLNLWCKHCKDMTSVMIWDETESEEIEVPALRDVTGGIDRVVLTSPKNYKNPNNEQKSG